MGSPEKPIDVELADMNPDVQIKGEKEELEPLRMHHEDDENEGFTGLTKEELMEVANQPNWKRARMILFILFWVIWVVMLVSAVFIVINAEKCKPIPEVQWYQDTVFVKFDPKRFGGLEKLSDSKKIEHFKDMKSSMVLRNVVDENWNLKEKVKAVAENAHNKGVMVLVDFPVSAMKTTSDKFTAVKGLNCTSETPKAGCDLFMWKNKTEAGFEKAEDSNDYYKGTKDSAEINFDSETAVNLLTEKLAAAINGSVVDGFLLSDTQSLYGYDWKKVLDAAFKKVNGTKHDAYLSAFFVEAHDDAAAKQMSKYFSAKSNTTESLVLPSPIVLQQVVSSTDPNEIKKNYEESRKDSRVFHAYQTSLSGATQQKSLAISMLNVALPGVSFIDLGEEVGNRKYDYNTDEEKKVENVKLDEAATGNLKAMTDLIKKKTVDTLSKHSMRYDTQNSDTHFEWLQVPDNMIGFCKKWGKKEPVFVLTNLGDEKVVDFEIKFSEKCGNMKEKVIASLASNNKYDFNRKDQPTFTNVTMDSTSLFWLKSA